MSLRRSERRCFPVAERLTGSRLVTPDAGKGKFGLVRIAQHKKSAKYFALKRISKEVGRWNCAACAELTSRDGERAVCSL